MSSATTLTGRQGKFLAEGQVVARGTKFDVNSSLATKSEWADSDSNGFTNRAPGRKDGTFDAEGKYDVDDEVWDLFEPEDFAESVLFLNATIYWAFPRAMCLDFKMSINMDTQEVIGWTSSFGADGEYFRPGAPNAPTHTIP